MHRVLILDANQRSALAAARSLGSKGIYVVTADNRSQTLAGASKYSNERFAYPPPHNDTEGFIECVAEEARKRHIDVLFPMTEITTALILQHCTRFSDITVPLPHSDSFEQLNNKYKLMKLADELSMSIPPTYFVQDAEDRRDLGQRLIFPVVLKPYQSRIWSNGRWISSSVKYVRSAEEFEQSVKSEECFREHPFLAQTYIHGQGQGIFALYNKGKPVTFFAHKRLREKPPSGGVSVLSESVELNPEMRNIAQTLLDRTAYHGVAMVEFKVSPDGTLYLMEVNARFWGSLQLAIDAGVDFPYLLYQIAIGDSPKEPSPYKIGIKNRWLLGDMDHLYLVMKGEPGFVLPWSRKWQTMKEFMQFFQPDMHYEVINWTDLSPFFFELRNYFLGKGRSG